MAAMKHCSDSGVWIQAEDEVMQLKIIKSYFGKKINSLVDSLVVGGDFSSVYSFNHLFTHKYVFGSRENLGGVEKAATRKMGTLSVFAELVTYWTKCI